VIGLLLKTVCNRKETYTTEDCVRQRQVISCEIINILVRGKNRINVKYSISKMFLKILDLATR
jgi:hypothetical protein